MPHTANADEASLRSVTGHTWRASNGAQGLQLRPSGRLEALSTWVVGTPPSWSWRTRARLPFARTAVTPVPKADRGGIMNSCSRCGQCQLEAGSAAM